MKKFLTVLLAGLLIVAFAAPAFAWEFNMKGEYEHRVRYLGRAGNIDLFGIASLQDTATIANTAGLPVETNTVGFAGPTLYNRGVVTAWASDSSSLLSSGRARPAAGQAASGGPVLLITRGGFSKAQSDALYNDQRLTLYPELRINPAIKVETVLDFGGYRNKYFQSGDGINAIVPGEASTGGVGLPPFERYYMHGVSMNAYDTASIVSVEQFRATAQTPWAVLSMGCKDFPFGTGASFARNTRLEAFLTVVPYGPFRFLHAVWLTNGRFVQSWNTTPDSQQKNSFFQALAATYENADLSLGLISIWRMYHQMRIDSTASGLLGGPVNGLDDNTLVNMAFMKYFNGRFFMNAEYGWLNVDQYRTGVPIGVNQLNAANVHLEGYHFFSELGAVTGPAKLSLAYALASGRVLNNNNITKVYAPWTINYQAMQPYQLLMFDTFAGGNNGGWNPLDVSFVADEHGMMSDAYAYAARLDYAVASNLNVWGSYIWAHRLERAGAFKGGILSNGAVASAAQRQAFVANNFGAASGEVGGPINPYVDNGYLGWEANVGVDWKLLEGMATYLRYSYWQPGDWFTQAYQAVGTRGGVATNDALVKGRDPIQGFTWTMVVDF